MFRKINLLALFGALVVAGLLAFFGTSSEVRAQFLKPGYGDPNVIVHFSGKSVVMVGSRHRYKLVIRNPNKYKLYLRLFVGPTGRVTGIKAAKAAKCRLPKDYGQFAQCRLSLAARQRRMYWVFARFRSNDQGGTVSIDVVARDTPFSVLGYEMKRIRVIAALP